MDITVKRGKIEQFSIILLIVGAFLLLASVIRGTYMVIAFVKGVLPLYTFSDVRVNVINVFFNFLIPFVGGILLVMAGLTMLKYRRLTEDHARTRKLRYHINQKREDMLSGLLSDYEKGVLAMIRKENGILQSDLVAKSGYSKVKMHRILKKLESMDVIKRSRFGITNKIFLNERA